ncbi:uncharacterized protein LOC131614548 [Vicia villosa]|uniref:uncharacterized protein LOC131614548 n=1 Tax=Vicia villosa TaxID=3911 RepID=UPI00273C31BE|nr:uncharacterized protein LOC131614548 [Vicia villosa]
MVKSSSPSFHKLRNSNNNQQQWSSEYDEKGYVHKCEYCHKVFSTGQALGGHKTCHRSNKQQVDDHHHVNKVYKTMKVTFSLSSSPSYHNNNVDAKQKRHSWTRVFKTTVHLPPTASTFKPSQQELPAVDLLSLLPPRSHATKKRSRRYLIHHGVANNTGVDETVAKEEKNLKEGETVLGPRGFRTLDLNELPTNDVERELGPRVVRDLDLNELPTNHLP